MKAPALVVMYSAYIGLDSPIAMLRLKPGVWGCLSTIPRAARNTGPARPAHPTRPPLPVGERNEPCPA